MEYRFNAFGHKNITGKHDRTLEFTKDKSLTLAGDCILGVGADFGVYELKKLIKDGSRLKMVIAADDVSDEVVFEPNPDFDDEKEIVVRMGDFSSGRTFGIRADKSCADLKRELVEKLKDSGQMILIRIEQFK